jgi:AcrR family transcriptional regulator
MTRRSRNFKAKAPKQERSKKTRTKIMLAAQELFSKSGFYTVNSNQIAAKAGVSVGTFYTYFRDKKDVLLNIMHLFYDDFWAKVLRGVQDDIPETYELETVLRKIVEKSFSVIDADPEFANLINSIRYYDEDIREIFETVEAREIKHISFLMTLSGDTITVKNREAAALITMRLIESLALARPRVDRDIIINEVTRMIKAYFTT